MWKTSFIGLLIGLAFVVACTSKDKVVEPVETPLPELVSIDSLMWQQPDSALAVMMEFSASSEADSLSEFEGHYCYVLIAELLFKNDYAQSNRTELLKAVGYFDSLMMANGAAVQERDAFLDARAHYINGAGYYEHDSLTEACAEYLNTLRIMESHFAENELVGKKARFMALTYGRLVDFFMNQLMPEPTIVCAKHALAYNRIAPTSKYGESKLYNTLGVQFDVLKEFDSAAYYYNKALEVLPDRNTIAYRDIISSWALFHHNCFGNTQMALDSLKSMVAKAANETERITRYTTIGEIYVDIEQYDSAKFYLEPVLEKDPDRAMIAAKSLKDIALNEGDTLKANEYSIILSDVGVTAADKQFLVSQLNDLFQNYLQEKQATASLRERKKAVRTTLAVVLPLVIVLAAVVVILTRRRSKKRLVAQEAEAQRRLDEASQRLSEAAQRHDEAERELQTKVEQAAQHTKEVLQQRVTVIYQSNSKDRMQRIREAFDDTYPQAVARLKAEHPELSETELNVLLLNFLRFRIKEEADLLGLSENTVGKYRSNLGKTLGKDPISDLIG